MYLNCKYFRKNVIKRRYVIKKNKIKLLDNQKIRPFNNKNFMNLIKLTFKCSRIEAKILKNQILYTKKLT